MTEQIHTSLEDDGILLATIDMPDKTMNVFSVALMDALDELMNRVESDPAVSSVVLTSGKNSFLAGADLVMVRGYTDAAATSSESEMFELCGRLGRQFVRLESSSKPWVAAVNGIALGGGLELALACRARLVTDDARTQIGLPEVRWGLLPGAGGTQRLPRLAGFDAAMDMLLTGRPVAPEEAVRLGIFERTVPAEQLVEEARALARSLQGRPYDAAAKFARLAQDDVPAFSDQAAREIATTHRVSPQDFSDYPAYSAIIDSVLKGARLPLAEATAVEMQQFLRLMFNPVAGNMVRTLFLERLRADRELAPPPGTRIEHIAVSEITEPRAAWTAALAKLKAPRQADASLPADTLELVDQLGNKYRIAIRTLEESPAAHVSPYALLSPAGQYGRVLEIVGVQGDAAGAVAALATQLRCLPWQTPGPDSVLQRLQGKTMEDQARIARDYAALAATNGSGEPAFIDVAACLAGVTPAWTGGPLNAHHQTNPTIQKR